MVEGKANEDFEREFSQKTIREPAYAQNGGHHTLQVGNEEQLVFEVVADQQFSIKAYAESYLQDLSLVFLQRYVYDPLCAAFGEIITPPHFLERFLRAHF